jgi:hypothetical protein
MTAFPNIIVSINLIASSDNVANVENAEESVKLNYK